MTSQMAPMIGIWGLYYLGCSHITNDLGSHRAQTRCLCTYLYLLLYTYKAYMIDISPSLYIIWGNTNNTSDYDWLMLVKGMVDTIYVTQQG